MKTTRYTSILAIILASSTTDQSSAFRGKPDSKSSQGNVGANL